IVLFVDQAEVDDGPAAARVATGIADAEDGLEAVIAILADGGTAARATVGFDNESHGVIAAPAGTVDHRLHLLGDIGATVSDGRWVLGAPGPRRPVGGNRGGTTGEVGAAEVVGVVAGFGRDSEADVAVVGAGGDEVQRGAGNGGALRHIHGLETQAGGALAAFAAGIGNGQLRSVGYVAYLKVECGSAARSQTDEQITDRVECRGQVLLVPQQVGDVQ